MSVTLSPPAIAVAIPAIPALLGYRPQDGQLTVLHLTAHDPDSWRVVGCHATQPGAPDDELPTVLSFMDAEADRLGFQLQGRLAVRQALRALEGQPIEPYLGPSVELVDKRSLARFPAQWMLPPAGFVPVYEIAPGRR